MVIKRNDIFLCIFFVLVGIMILAYAFVSKESGKTVRVTVNGEVTEYPLIMGEDKEYLLESDLGNNKIRIGHGVVEMIEADCKDQLCVKQGEISDSQKTIICLPHQVVVEIVE